MAPVQRVLLGAALALLMRTIYLSRADAWGYMGYQVRPTGWLGILASAVAIVLCMLALSPEIRRPSQLVVWLCSLLLFLPILVLAPLMTGADNALLSGVIGSHLLAIGILARVARRGQPENGEVLLDGGVWWSWFWMLTGCCAALALVTFKVNFVRPSVDPYVVYGLRDQFRELVAQRGSMVGYLLFGLAKIIVPLGIGLALHARRLAFVAALVGLQLYLFSVSGHKSTLAILVVVALLAVLASLAPGRRAKWVGVGATGGLASLWLLSTTSGVTGAMLIDILFRRLLATPAMLAVEYFRYFGEHPYAWFSYVLPDNLIYSHYAEPIPMVVGSAVFGRPGLAANTGFVASGFSDAGYAGVIVIVLVLAAFLLVLDRCARDLPTVIWLPVVGAWAWAITETAFQTALVTHGGLLLLGLLAALHLTVRPVRSTIRTLPYG